jgi:hypothetical protein
MREVWRVCGNSTALSSEMMYMCEWSGEAVTAKMSVRV